MSVDTTRADEALRDRLGSGPSVAGLSAAVIGFFVVTLDAVVVNVALPSIQDSLGGGIAGLQWVVDGYTLMFAALLLSAGSLTDRIGARTGLALGAGVFAAASVACALAPTLGWLVAARLVQGSAAALVMPASLTLVSETHTDPVRRGRAVAIWAMGGAVASTSGPVAGGALTAVDWRLIFLVNVPVVAAALVALRRTPASPRRPTRIDLPGQVTAVVAMTALTFATVEAGAAGLLAMPVLLGFGLAALGAAAFVRSQARSRAPMVPLEMFRGGVFRISLAAGFSFMVGYFGLPFLMSLELQRTIGLSAVTTGVVFLPMMLIGLVLTPLSPRIVERVGARPVITAGFASMTIGLGLLAALAGAAPVWVLSLLMVLVGLGGPLTMPPVTALLLHHVAPKRTGTASGVFNTSRQLGGALSVAVFGAVVAHSPSLTDGVRLSLGLAAMLLAATTAACLRLPAARSARAPKTSARSGGTSTAL